MRRKAKSVLPDFSDIRFNCPPRFHFCEPGWSWTPSPLLDCDLWYVADGEGNLMLNGERFELQCGKAFVFAPGDRIRAVQNPAKRLVVFAFHFDFLDTGNGVIFQEPEKVHAHFPPGMTIHDRLFLEAMAARCQALFRRKEDVALRRSRLLAQQILLHFWDEAHQPEYSHLHEPLQNLITQILQEPNRDWSTQLLAKQSHLSRSQLVRRFKKATGVAPNEFVIRARLERAHHLITETGMTISQISQALGYSDVGFFCRQFKRFNGCAPSALRSRQ